MAPVRTPAWRTPVRDVQATAGSQTNCSGFARAVADFEPQPDPSDGFAFVVALEERPGAFHDDELAAWCCEHVESGVRAELAEHFGGMLPPVRVVLRRVLQHPVDSNEPRNREAGRRLVLRALETLESAP
ncbi:hypothetical protein GA0070216_13127 [Micromonospora matsumotoense]|uniref:Uncharacterized protein n=1 Tax=Micromonospora matsumotoense TaxID=121616 RepID=A0A1C5AVK9_9ACTN|nr:hypothetical protein [Micromonospora matsumotoense]SCF49074.1 hypothetical protein GA0070216_13127 [Micromonospora matsumotoense]